VLRGKESADRQGWLEHATRTTRGNMTLHLSELAAKLSPAETAMRKAQDSLRTLKKADEVTPDQDDALKRLREVKSELDQLLAEEDKDRNDPLTNLKDALARVEKLIEQQKSLKDDTTTANAAKKSDRTTCRPTPRSRASWAARPRPSGSRWPRRRSRTSRRGLTPPPSRWTAPPRH
jgi:hypothetical protein